MSEQKLTPWFPPAVKPVRRGVYETEFCGVPGFSRWTGEKWANQAGSPSRALEQHVAGAWQAKGWRGLAGDPDAR